MPWPRRYPRIPGPRIDVGEVVPGLYQHSLHSTSFFVVEDGLDQESSAVSVVDAGWRVHSRRVLEYLGSLGHGPGSIRRLVATHYHLDHVGGMAGVQNATGLPVEAHWVEADRLKQEHKGDVPNPVQQWWLRALLWPLIRYMQPPAIPLVKALDEGDALPLLKGARVIHTPGHTPGSISLHLPDDGVLIAGDAMQRRGDTLTTPSPFFSSDMATAKDSIRKLATLDFEVLCLSHFLPMRKGARAAVRSLAEYVS